MSNDAASSSGEFVVGDGLRNALAVRDRPTPPNLFSSSLTFGWRALLKIKHVPEQLFDVTLFPIMFTLMFTYLFGGALEGSTSEYLQYLLPGILVQTVVFITMYTGTTLNNDIEKGVFDRFRSLPVWRPSPLVGAMLADVLRFSMAGTMVIALGLILGWRTEGGGALGVLASMGLLLLFCFSLSWVWTLLGMVLRTPNAVLNLSMMVLFPLTFASNIFVDPSTMPGWLQAFVDVNPVTHLVEATRQLMSGHLESSELVWVLAASALLNVVFAPLAMWRYTNR